MNNKENPLWNLNELCSNWMVFVVFVGFLSAAGIYQHYQCVKMNKEISFASMVVLKNLASFIATDGEFF